MKLYQTTSLKPFLYSYIRLALITCIGIALSACQITHQQNKHALALHLNQYIGQTTDQLEQTFNLDAFNIQLNPNPIFTPERAIFSFDRMLSLAIPAGKMMMDQHGVMIPVQIASTDNNYSSKQPCNIIFVLKDNVVQSVSMKGKAC